MALNAAAQESPLSPLPNPLPAEPEITLDELVRRLSEKSPQATIAREGVEAARQRVSARGASPSPHLLLVPALGSREARDEETVLAQPLDVFGLRRARVAVAKAELRRAQTQLTLAERALLTQVKSAAVDLFAAQESEALNVAQVEVAEAFAKATGRRAELGEAPAVQAERAELEVLRAQNELEAARADRLARRAALNVLIGQEAQTPLRIAPPTETILLDPLRRLIFPPASGSTSASAIEPADFAALRPRLLDLARTRPDIEGAQALVEVRRAQALELNAERRPTVEIQLRRAAVLSSNGGLAVRAVLNIPLFGNKALRGEKRALEAETRAQEAQTALLRAQAAGQLEIALVRWQERRATAERYRTALVPRTLELLRKTQLGYTAGASTYLEVLEAQRTLRQVQSEYLLSLVGARTQEVALENAVGGGSPVETAPATLTPRRENP